MDYDDCLLLARAELRHARHLLIDEIRSYPTPVSGCDTQYNHLIGQRAAVDDALAALDAPRFVATPRMPTATSAVESR